MLRAVMLAGMIAVVPPCSAQPPSRVVVVLDVSGRVARTGPGGAPILDTVGAVVVDTVGAMSTSGLSVQIALRTAGGSAADDRSDRCASTALELAPDLPDPASWARALASVVPDGPCPLIHATTEAVEDIQSDAAPGRVVVVTAGGDDCNGRTADVAAAMAAAKEPIELRLVGLGLTPETLDRFAGVPQRNAASDSDLRAALAWALLDVDSEASDPADPEPPPASVSVPPTAVAGEPIEVIWTGPEGAEDFISLARPGDGGNDYLDWRRAETGSPSLLTAPREPGPYEIRYVDGSSGDIIAQSPIEVAGRAVILEAPSTVAPGTRVPVHWQGPNAVGDFIALARPGAPVDRVIDWATTATGSPITLAVPMRPGRLEIRYITSSGSEIAALIIIEVAR